MGGRQDSLCGSGGGGASTWPGGPGKGCWSRNSHGQLCDVGDSECHVPTLSAMMTLKNGWWVEEESERKRIGGTETKVRHLVRSGSSNGQLMNRGRGRDGLGKTQGEAGERDGGREREIRLGKHKATQRGYTNICWRKWQVFCQHIHQWRVLEARSKNTPGCSISEAPNTGQVLPDSESCVCLLKA